MEQENISPTMQPEQTWGALNQVTPLSKYLAMILFVALPFIGGWVGYIYAPEKVITVKETILKEEGIKNLPEINNISLKKTDEIASLTTITTSPIDQSLRGDYADEKNYAFNNGIYTVSFTYPREMEILDDYVDVKKSWNDLYQVHFFKNTEENGRVILLSYYVHGKDFCRHSLCEKESSTTLDILGNQWDSLGGQEYCDAGQCASKDYIYRRFTDGFVEYIEMDIPISEALNDEGVFNILSTLKFNIN